MMAEKLYYSMGEVAEMMDVSLSLLRFWEQKFDILTPKKNKKGNRMFSPEDVRNLKTIYHLVKERGMTLAGAQKYLKASRGAIERDMEIAERLGTIRALLLEVRNQLGGGGVVVDDTVTEEIEIAVEVEVAENRVVVVTDRVIEEVIEPIEEKAEQPEPEPQEPAQQESEQQEPEPQEPAQQEPEQQEPEQQEPARPQFIEQTLF